MCSSDLEACNMATIKFRGKDIQTCASLPKVGEKAPNFVLTGTSMGQVSLNDFPEKKKVLNIFPSIDTEVCALSVKRFSDTLAKQEDVLVINISKDLPFAQVRFCAAEGIENVEVFSAFRSDFGQSYGVEMTTGPLAALFCRVVIVLDEQNTVTHVELANEITSEVNYDKVLEALGKSSQTT